MSVQKTVTQQFNVEIESTYNVSESRPEEGYFFFVYNIRIRNSGNASAQLMNRHWIITDALGRIEEVRGPGVVGLQPHIKPGQFFSYESACPLRTSSGSMKGTYEMRGSNGENFNIEIPEFFLISPQALH
ncbi:MAG: Co2+/Mg2+ efflux protein ApaG [Bdellovibrionota bacterium]